MKRRTAIGMLGSVAGGPLLAPPGEMERILEWALRVRDSAGDRTAEGNAANGIRPDSATTLTPRRARAMEALAEAIVPATADSPGASAAGVTEFVSALVDGWLDDEDRDRFLAGLDRADEICRERFAAPFADLDSADQAVLLGEWDEELAALRESPDGPEGSRFLHPIDFGQIKRFALTAFFTSEAGLAALGHRTVFSTFEACAPVASGIGPEPPEPSDPHRRGPERNP